MPSVAIMDDIDDAGVELLKRNGFDVLRKEGFENADAIIVRSATRVNSEFIDRCKSLKLIVRAGVGLDNIDVEYAKSKGIEVRNTPRATSISVAELTLGLMLSALRMIPYAHLSTKAGKWEKKSLKGREIYGKVVGLVGLGNIGLEVAKRCEAFGAEIVYYDVVDRRVYKRLELGELFETANIVSLHLPLTDETRGIINYPLLMKLKEQAVIVNTARGELIPTHDLVKFLKERRDVIAALDVFESEPPPKEILELENVIITPHIGAQTKEAQLRASIEAAKVIIDFFK
ncbi:MAG: hydroxyacid dehydrogenase [candidate division WOR-3 bacterium]